MALTKNLLGPIRKQARESGTGLYHAAAYTSTMMEFTGTGAITPTTIDAGKVSALSFFAEPHGAGLETIIRLATGTEIQISRTNLSTPGSDDIYIDGYTRSDYSMLNIGRAVHIVINLEDSVISDNLAIGGGTTSYDGTISHVCLFKNAISAATAERLFMNPLHALTIDHLIHYWPLVNPSYANINPDLKGDNYIQSGLFNAVEHGLNVQDQKGFQYKNEVALYSLNKYCSLGSIAASSGNFFSCSTWFVPHGTYAGILYKIGIITLTLNSATEIEVTDGTTTFTYTVPSMTKNLCHVVFTNDTNADESVLYFNGGVIDTKTSLSHSTSAASTLGDGTTYFLGAIYEVATWERILSKTETAVLYNAVGQFDYRQDYNQYSSSDLSIYIQDIGDEKELYNKVDFSTYSYNSDMAIHTLLPSTFEGTNDYYGFPCLLNKGLRIGAPVDSDPETPILITQDNADLDFTTAFTIAAWVKIYRVQNTSSPGVIADKRDAYYLEITNGYEMSVGMHNGTSFSTVTTSGAAITRFKWHYLAVVCDGTNAVFYIDGVQDSSSALSVTMPGSSEDLTIGARIVSGTRQDGLRGIIDDLVVYDKALTAAQIQQNYDSTKATHWDG